MATQVVSPAPGLAAVRPEANAPSAAVPAVTETPSPAKPRRRGCRWVLWILLVVAIAITSGTVSFALKRRSILFFSDGGNQNGAVDPAVLSTDVAKAIVEDFYRHVSAKDMDQARTLIGGSLADQLDPNSTFFEQFDRVSVERLTVTNQTDSTTDLTGYNTYYYPDGTTQEEERTFTVEMLGNDPRIVASQFVRVSQPRQ